MTPDYSPARALLAAARRHPNRLSLVDAITGEEGARRRIVGCHEAEAAFAAIAA